MSNPVMSDADLPPFTRGICVHVDGPELHVQGRVAGANLIGITLEEDDGSYFYPWAAVSWVKLNLSVPIVSAPTLKAPTMSTSTAPALASASRWSRDQRNDLYRRAKTVRALGIVNAATCKGAMAELFGHDEPYSDDEWDGFDMHVARALTTQEREIEARANANLAKANAAAADVDLTTMPMPRSGGGRH